MPPDDVRLHPHIFHPNAAARHDFSTPRPGRGKALSLQARDRAQHAARLLGQMEGIEPRAAERVAAQKAEGVDAGNGVYLQFDSEPGFDLKFESLDFGPSGIELCAVRRVPNDRLQATVFVPDGRLSFFLKRIMDYRDGETRPKKDGSTRPKNRELVERHRRHPLGRLGGSVDGRSRAVSRSGVECVLGSLAAQVRKARSRAAFQGYRGRA